MSNKDTSFSLHMLGVEMNVINLNPDSFVHLFLWFVAIYAAVRVINLGIKFAEVKLNLK